MNEKPSKVRESIEDISEDAWQSRSLLPDQAKELWACVWSEHDGALGCTYVPLIRRQHLREAAMHAGCWWVWTRNGEAMYLTLSAARAMFSGEVVSMNESTALATLESMRDTSSGEDRRALEWAIAKISTGR